MTGLWNCAELAFIMKASKKQIWILSLITVFILLGTFFFFVLEKVVETELNGLFSLPPGEREITVPVLHQDLFVSDLHADTLLWDRNLLKENSRGHVDLPRLQKGHIALQAFSVVTKAPLFFREKNDGKPDGVTLISIASRWPKNSWSSLSERALYQARKLRETIAQSQGKMRLILNKNDLRQFREDRKKDPTLVGAWLTIEGGHALDGDLSKLDSLFEAGFRMIGPVHLFDNELGGSRSGENQGGLTNLGKRWIKQAEQKNIIVDLAHLSDQATGEALREMTRPPVVSHTGVRGVCPVDRNLSDEYIKLVAQKKGIIGIGLWKAVLCETSLAAVVKSMKYVCKLVGCQHVALGSDWDGTVSAAVDSAHIGQLTGLLLKEGLTENEIRGIMGENVYRFLLENLPN